MNQEYQDTTAEVVDENTGELLPAVVEQNAIANWQGIAQQPFDDKTAKTLEADIPDDKIEIRLDGMVYLPQAEYRRRLNKAFGVGAWALRRLDVMKKDNTVIYDGELWANGRYIASAMGEQDYFENNKNMSWATAVESAKSDCLTRCCKDIGIAIDLWNPRFVKKWKGEHAVQVWCDDKKQNKPKQLWRRKDDPPIDQWPFKEQSGNGNNQQPPPKTPAEGAETGRTSTQGEKGDSSPHYAESARIKFVNYAKQVMKDQLPAPMPEALEKYLMKADKTVDDQRALLKWFSHFICEGDKEKINKQLLEWSTGRGHSGFGTFKLDEVDEKEIVFAYGKSKKDFKVWIDGLDGKAEPPESLSDLAESTEKKGGKPE